MRDYWIDMERGKVKIYDFSKCIENAKDYGGNSGQKLGIRFEDEDWILKFPKSTRNFKNPDISYTTSPISEFIGSHIYEMLGIPVHETRLGIYGSKLVVACKDFTNEYGALKTFEELKNRYSQAVDEFYSHQSSGNGLGVSLEDVETLLEISPALNSVKGLKEHFWNMFVVDEFIGNNDRNNGNWGAVTHNEKTICAPVFDNGNSFRNKASDREYLKTLSSEESMRQSAYETQTCFFLGKDGRKINPALFILNNGNRECGEAIKRIVPRIDMKIIKEFINSIPGEFQQVRVMSDAQRKYDWEILKCRYEKILLPALESMYAVKKQNSLCNRLNEKKEEVRNNSIMINRKDSERERL